MDKDYTARRGKMSTYPKTRRNNYEVWISPSGVRKYLKWLPYLSGNPVKLSLSVKGLSPSKSLKFYWLLRRYDMGMHPIEPPVDSSCEGENRMEEIKGGSVVILNKRLFINGKHTLHVWFEKDDHTFEEQVLCEFNVLDKDLTTRDMFAASIGGVIGVMLGLTPTIIQVINGLLRK